MTGDPNGYDWSGGDPGVDADLASTPVTPPATLPLLPVLGHEIPMYRTDCLTRGEWVKRRTGTIGASAVAAIMQRNPYSTPIQVWSQITGRRKRATDDEDEIFRMELGTVCEPQIRQVVADTLGVPLLAPDISAARYVTAWPQVLQHPRLPFFTCNLDAVFFDGSARMPVECKWTNFRNREVWHELRETRDPMSCVGTSVFSYLIQVQSQLAITGLSRGILIGIIGEDAANRLLVNALTGRVGLEAFDPKDRDVVVVYVDRDEATIAAIERVVERFHSRFVAAGKVPPVTDHRDAQALREAWQASKPVKVTIDKPDMEPACARYLAIGDKLREGEKLRDKVKAELLHVLASEGLDEFSAGQHRVTYKADKRDRRTLRVKGPASGNDD